VFFTSSFIFSILTALVEAGYHSTNPYHNSIHATDVTQAMHCFLQEEKVSYKVAFCIYDALSVLWL
jgi:hypothetical protein